MRKPSWVFREPVCPCHTSGNRTWLSQKPKLGLSGLCKALSGKWKKSDLGSAGQKAPSNKSSSFLASDFELPLSKNPKKQLCLTLETPKYFKKSRKSQIAFNFCQGKMRKSWESDMLQKCVPGNP